jgi:hypothetical protein
VRAKPETWRNSHARRPTNRLKFIRTGSKNKFPAITTINPKIPMLISKTMTNAINEQIGNEFAASLQYVAIASRFDADALSVLAGHFYRQAGEERDHAMRFIGPLLLEQLKNRFVEADRRILLAAQPVDALAPRGDERPRHQRAVRLELRPLVIALRATFWKMSSAACASRTTSQAAADTRSRCPISRFKMSCSESATVKRTVDDAES